MKNKYTVILLLSLTLTATVIGTIISHLVDVLSLSSTTPIGYKVLRDSITLSVAELAFFTLIFYTIYEELYNHLKRKSVKKKFLGKVKDRVMDVVSSKPMFSDMSECAAVKQEQDHVFKDMFVPKYMEESYARSIFKIDPSMVKDFEYAMILNTFRAKPDSNIDNNLWNIWYWYNTSSDRFKELVSLRKIYNQEVDGNRTELYPLDALQYIVMNEDYKGDEVAQPTGNSYN